jgi:hypothetical protein
MKIEIIVEKTKTDYSAYAEKYPVYTKFYAHQLELLVILFSCL